MKVKLGLIILGLAATLVIALLFRDGTKHGAVPVVVFGEDSSNLQAYASLKDDFLTASGIAVTFEGTTFEQSIQKADADFRSGSGNFDIVLQYNFSLAPYVKNRYVAEITNVFSSSVLESSQVNTGMFDNALKETCYYYSDPSNTKSPAKQFGFPFAANTMLLVYNRALFDDEGLKQAYKAKTGKDLAPPADWPAYLEVAEFFAQARTGLKGVCMQGSSGGWLYYEMCNYLFSMGTGTSSKRYGWEQNASMTIATPENEEVLRFCKRLHATTAGDFFTTDASRQRDIMLQGQTAMALMWSDYVQPLAASKDPLFGFAPIPGKVSGLAGGAFYINRKSRQMKPASDFVLYSLNPKNQEKLIDKGLCSAMKSAYTEEVMTRVPYARALRDSLERGIFMFEAGTDAEIINSAITTWVQKFIRGECSEKEALNNAKQEVLTKRAKN